MSNWYPRGKLKESDEGACFISIRVEDKTVLIDFGKDLSWIGIDKQQAINLGNAIIQRANEIK